MLAIIAEATAVSTSKSATAVTGMVARERFHEHEMRVTTYRE
jgi:hypothetical protein